jgi:hypothetical protein
MQRSAISFAATTHLPSAAYRTDSRRLRGAPSSASVRLNPMVVGFTLTQCDPCAIRSTSHWTAAAIDEYELVVHPRLAGHGPTLFAGLSKHVDLTLVSRLELSSGAVALRYELRR